MGRKKSTKQNNIWERSGAGEKLLFISLVLYSGGSLALLGVFTSEYLSGLTWVARYLAIPLMGLSFLITTFLNRFEKRKLFSWKSTLLLVFYLLVTIEPYVLVVNAKIGRVETVTLPVVLIKKDRLPTGGSGAIVSHLGTFRSQQNDQEYSVYISEKFFWEAPIGRHYKLDFKVGSLGIYFQDDSIKGDRGIHGEFDSINLFDSLPILYGKLHK